MFVLHAAPPRRFGSSNCQLFYDLRPHCRVVSVLLLSKFTPLLRTIEILFVVIKYIFRNANNYVQLLSPFYTLPWLGNNALFVDVTRVLLAIVYNW